MKRLNYYQVHKNKKPKKIKYVYVDNTKYKIKAAKLAFAVLKGAFKHNSIAGKSINIISKAMELVDNTLNTCLEINKILNNAKTKKV